MGWDDDDDDEWDVDDIEAKLEAQLKEKERQRRRDEGLDSESEEEKPKEDVPKPKPKPKPKVDKKKGKETAPEPEAPALNSQEEKLRRRKLVEEADARLADDLFSGCEKPSLEKQAEEEEEKARKEEAARKAAAAKPKILVVDAFDKVELKVQADVEKLCTTCVEKLGKGQAKNSASKFLIDCLKQLEGNLDLKELGELEKSISEVVKQKQVEKGQRLAKDNKANTKLSKTTKFNASSEWEEVYGGGEGDEDWTQEEWDEWYRKEGYK
uniref:Eukaryotic translation initiation factor 3 30 kDa subunit n=1 Tax=Alexandrium monilatum TaxID=311494 RepID=A0A7S4SAT7_9DINO|mmetsp:Transcript_87247/g.260272  ORF Transcript_87247/g.260272 Transcript_87247/m.260272 type:complete len:268 (-) Transcript_87247:42-845(-)